MFKRIFFSSTLVVAPIMSSVAFKVNDKEQNVLKDFFDLANNKQKLDQRIKDEYDALSKKAKNNQEYLKFISSKDVDFTKKDQTVEKIYDLNLEEDLKLFLLSNYIDKYEFKYRLSDNSLEKSLSRNKRYRYAGPWLLYPDNSYVGGGSSTNLSKDDYLHIEDKDGNYEYLKDEYGYEIEVKGQTKKETDYYDFWPDTTYFYWNTQRILNVFLSDFVSKSHLYVLTALADISPSLFKEFKQVKNEEGLTTWIIKLQLEKYINKNFGSYSIRSEMKSFVDSSIAKAITNRIANNVDKDHNLSDFWDSEAVAEIKKLVPNIVGTVTFKVLSKTLILGALAGIGAKVLTEYIIWALFDNDSGNGHSLIENLHDHGLNDWDFQWKNNLTNLAGTAFSFSKKLSDGIVWKVVDGWFSYPDLYIKSQSNSSYKLLSPDNEFNWGNKIPLTTR